MSERSLVVGCGAHLPERILTNDELAKQVDTSDEWITERTGIKQRHVAAEGECTSDLATKAAQAALADAGLEANDIDLIVLATATPDRTFPATATRVQNNIGMTRGAAFDVQAVCTGFVYALATADALLATGQGRRALVIGAETFSRILDWEDRSTCVLFGDGAGALVIERGEGGDGIAGRGVHASKLYSDGRHEGILYVDGGPSSTQTVGHLRMSGREVFRQAVGKITAAMKTLMEETGVTADDIALFVPHQANQRIINTVAQKLSLAPEKVVSTIARHANTSAASVPLAMAEAQREGRLKRGDLVMVEAMGGGFTWGVSLLRW
jgi:3-oxoacyl-[acyl-carrier-protein] synthase-3